MADHIKKLEKQLQELIRKKTDENAAFNKILGKLTENESGKKDDVSK